MSSGLYLTGWAAVRVTGPEPERFLTLLAEKGVPFRGAAPPEAFTVTLRVPLGQAEKTLRLAAAEGCEAAILDRRGLPAAAGTIRRRRWAAGMAAAILLALLWSQSFIWSIDISGNETIPDGPVLQALSECGVEIGARWLGMHQDTIRNGVILRLPGIRWMTVTMQGSKAHVIVREAREPLMPVPEDEYAKITADRTGLVTHVYALRGTAEAQTGRFVMPGDVVIGGYATGRFGVQGPVRAIGYADVRTWYEITAAAPSELVVKRPSGGKNVSWAVILGDHRINFTKDSSICPPGCDKIIKSYPLELPGVFTLPVTLEKTVTVPRDTFPMTAAELPEELMDWLTAELSRRIGEDGEIVSTEFSVWEAGGMTYCTLAAECTERIGRTVPLTEGDLAAIEAKIPKTEE